MLLDPLDQFAPIAAIGPDSFQPLPERLRKGIEQELSSISALNGSRMNYHIQQIAHRIDQDMAFASFHLLTRIIATFATNFRGFDTLAIDNRRTRLVVASRCLSYLFA